jgi:hypothetical protein
MGRTTTGAARAVATALLVALAASCVGGSDDVATEGSGSTTTPTTTGETTGQATGSSTSTGTGTATATSQVPSPSPSPTKKKKGLIAWVLGLAPGSPSGPASFATYLALQERRCADVFDRIDDLDEPARTLYTGAANGCLAAFEDRAELWDQSRQALEQVRPRGDELNCMDLAALDVLTRLVDAHEQQPDRAFRPTGEGSWSGPPCPAVSRVLPDRGEEGTTVTLEGSHLDAQSGVDVVDSLGLAQPAEVVSVSGGSMQVVMPEEPPSEGSVTVCVVVRAEPGWNAAGALFTYESDDLQPPTTLACPPPEDG